MRITVAALLLSAACAGPGGGTATTVDRTPGAFPVATEGSRTFLPAGTILRLLPISLDDADAERPALDGMWREAMRQSSHLDVAAGHEDCESPHAVALHLDASSGVLTASLRTTDGPRPLAVIDNALPAWPAALDRAAQAVRAALGDDPQQVGGGEPTRGVRQIYSAEVRAVLLVESALKEGAEGRLRGAIQGLQRARQADPGCTLTLALLAEAELDAGAHEKARSLAREALGYENRLSPTTRHRLARTMLLAQAREPGSMAPERMLLELARVGGEERPHDPQVRYTRALALNLASEFEQAAPLWRELRGRWPRSGTVAYHLALAELGLHQPLAALAALEAGASRMSRWQILLPRAMALSGAGRHIQLDRELTELAEEPAVRNSGLIHELRRMQAAHALLTGRKDAAARYLLEDLEWMRQRPTQLDRLALDLAEAGWVLARLGKTRELAPFVEAIERLRPSKTVRTVLTFLSGLIAVAENLPHEAAARSLEQEGQEVFSGVLHAAFHRREGRLLDEATALSRAALSSEDPLVLAGLARAMQQAGKLTEAAEVLDALRERLRRVDLRRLRDLPICSPGSALAMLATMT